MKDWTDFIVGQPPTISCGSSCMILKIERNSGRFCCAMPQCPVCASELTTVRQRGGIFHHCPREFGAGGRTRTDTTFYGPRILSPVRLPFRHTGYPMFTVIS